MKKVFFILFFLFNIRIVLANDLTSYSKSAIMLEESTGKIVYSLNEHDKLPPASMTKLMTLLLAMERIDNGDMKYDDIVLVSANAANMGGSQVFLEANSKISVLQLIKGIAIASGNDAAVALAEHIAGSTQ